MANVNRYSVKVEIFSKMHSGYFCVRYSTNYGISWDTLNTTFWIRQLSIKPNKDQPFMGSQQECVDYAQTVKTIEQLNQYNKRLDESFQSLQSEYNDMKNRLPKSITIV